MPVEIERRFLVVGRPWEGHAGTPLAQAYVAEQEGRTVRVRVAGDVGTLTIKGPSVGASRYELELPLDVAVIHELLAALSPPGRIEKVRYEIPGPDGRTWEVDVFSGTNAGLVLAEVEIEAEDAPVVLPDWVGREVTTEGRYTNAALARHPWGGWAEEER